jgi:hypothetical protein
VTVSLKIDKKGTKRPEKVRGQKSSEMPQISSLKVDFIKIDRTRSSTDRRVVKSLKIKRNHKLDFI